uniref:Reverse transcriptase Ty1/copia-type domain-containing protein n=1 Tax=Peronospora matthiolae TaxID=2874970 RepID=A0AAV1TND8_9STRA
MIFVALYVDDLVLASNNDELLKSTKKALGDRFDMTDLGNLKYFLGLEVDQEFTVGTISIRQSKIAKDILEKFGMEHSNPVKTPQEPGLNLKRSMCEGGCKHEDTMTNVPYRNAVGCLMYLMVGTRPDLAAAVGVLSQFVADPCPTHWQALKRVFSWRSKKQRTVALSSTEAEYMALTEATQEAVWLKAFLCEIGEMKNDEAVKIYEDNQGSIALAKNPEFHKRTKHIDIRYHFVREKVADGQVLLQYCAMKNRKADLTTKPIPTVQFEYRRDMLGIKKPRSAGLYGSTIPRVTGSIPVGRANDKVKPSGSGVWGSPALSCQTVTSPTFGTFGCLETHDQN